MNQLGYALDFFPHSKGYRRGSLLIPSLLLVNNAVLVDNETCTMFEGWYRQIDAFDEVILYHPVLDRLENYQGSEMDSKQTRPSIF